MQQELVEGDAFKLLKDLEDDSAHCAIVDYPWEFSIQNGTGRYEYRGKEGRAPSKEYREKGHENEMYEMAADEDFHIVLYELSRVLVDGGWILCMADDRFQDVIRESLKDSPDWIFRRNWAWTPCSMGMGYYGRVDHYPIPVATNGETERYVQGRGTLYEIPKGRQTEYPTGKPVQLYRELLEPPVIEDGERLLEPFCGSAPGRAVAVERGLGYWGCDVDVDAIEQARERTGQDTLGDW